MRIILLSMPRTRSSVLIDGLSKKYKVPNLYETYRTVSPDETSKLLLFKKSTLMWSRFKEEAKKKTQELLDNNSSYAVKLFPINIFNDYQYNPQFTKHPNWNISRDSLLDLEEHFQISKYDQIYLLQRDNIVDNICSYMYAFTTNFFLTESADKAKTMQPRGKVNLTTSKYYTAKCFILYKKYLDYIQIYLDKKNLSYTKLEYNTVPEFISDHFADVKLDTVDTNYDYKNFIKNYDEIAELVYKIEREVDQEFSDVIF